MSLAFFDLDGTLLPGGSSERRLLRRLFRHGPAGATQAAALLTFLAGRWPRYGRQVLKKNKAYLHGLPVEAVAELGRELVERELLPALDPCCRARLESHAADGDRVVLLTGAPAFIAEPLALRLPIDRVVATLCATRDGRFLGAAPVRHPFGAAKRALAEEIGRELNLPLGDAAAYADSIDDLALLSAVGTPVAVHPDRRLARVAAHKGWKVID